MTYDGSKSSSLEPFFVTIREQEVILLVSLGLSQGFQDPLHLLRLWVPRLKTFPPWGSASLKECDKAIILVRG
jgi:hypothetical protein